FVHRLVHRPTPRSQAEYGSCPHRFPQVWRESGPLRNACKVPSFAVFWEVGMLAARVGRGLIQGAERRVEHQIELTAESLWGEVAGRLRGALNDTTYGTWFGEAQGLELEGDRFVLAVPNDFTRDWIEGHFLGLIGAAIRHVPPADRPV